jgi:peptide/nickel transport system substrate-binding protein
VGVAAARPCRAGLRRSQPHSRLALSDAIGILRFNQLYPPFDNPAIRRALLGAVDQAEAMTAIAGTYPANWRDGIGLFGTGTPLATDVGIEELRTPRDYSAVKQALAQLAIKVRRLPSSPRPMLLKSARCPRLERTSFAELV